MNGIAQNIIFLTEGINNYSLAELDIEDEDQDDLHLFSLIDSSNRFMIKDRELVVSMIISQQTRDEK